MAPRGESLLQLTHWSAGLRPRVDGNRVRWESIAEPDRSYASFRSYLETVFTYAGSASLELELDRLACETGSFRAD